MLNRARPRLLDAGHQAKNLSMASLRLFNGVESPMVTRSRFAQYWFKSTNNAGDVLSTFVTNSYVGARSVWVGGHFSGKVLGLGSIAESIRPGDWVVGSGLIRGESREVSRRVKYFCVRGPLTRHLLGDPKIPETYGDPGLLVPEIMRRRGLLGCVEESERPIGVIPHYTDTRVKRLAATVENVVVMDVTSQPVELISRIKQCSAVISSSLHGIVFAEALGVPAVWLEPVDSIIGGSFKFHDYYLGTGRAISPAFRFEEAVEWAGCAPTPPHIDASAVRDAHVRLGEELRS